MMGVYRVALIFHEFSIDPRELDPVKINSHQNKICESLLLLFTLTATTCILYNCNGESLLSLGKFVFKINSV